MASTSSPAAPAAATTPRPTLNFITGNANKLREVQRILGTSYDIRSQDLDLPEIQGDPEDVARDKCRRAAEKMNKPVLVEDTSLGFTALNGLPGVYIKHFMKHIGHEGLNNMLAAYDDKSATATCIFAYSAGAGHEPTLFRGDTKGKIVPARGPTNFGWDAVFEYNGETYAEMDADDKNGISHRGKALRELQAWFARNVPGEKAT